jgi:hypothetical protein
MGTTKGYIGDTMRHGVPNITKTCQTTYEERRMKITTEIQENNSSNADNHISSDMVYG